MRIPTLAGLLASALLASCLGPFAGTSKTKHEYGWECAWCAESVETFSYTVEENWNINGTFVEIKRYGPGGGVRRIAYQVASDPEAFSLNAIAADRATLSPGRGYKVDGALFHSLRCANSYCASKDIKETRIRVIQGE